MTSKTQETMKEELPVCENCGCKTVYLKSLEDENAKLWKELEEQYKYHLRFVSESSVPCDEMDGYLEHQWQQFKSNLLTK
jgi:hypothetical protein